VRNVILLIVLPVMFTACTTTLEEAYNAYPGKAKIVSIKISPYNPTGKMEYCDIFFDFTPDDLSVREKYIYKKFPDKERQLFHDHRGNHNKKWVADTGIAVNKVYPAIRYEKKGGFGGAPVFFKVSVQP